MECFPRRPLVLSWSLAVAAGSPLRVSLLGQGTSQLHAQRAQVEHGDHMEPFKAVGCFGRICFKEFHKAVMFPLSCLTSSVWGVIKGVSIGCCFRGGTRGNDCDGTWSSVWHIVCPHYILPLCTFDLQRQLF